MHMKRLHGTVGTPRGPVGFGLPRRRDAAAAHLAAAHLAAALVTMLCGCASVVGNSGAPRHRGFLGWAPGLPPRLLWRERRLMALRMCDSPMNGEGLQPAQPPVRAVPPPQQRPTAGHDASAPPARRTDEEGSLRGGLRGRDHRGRGSITVSRHGGSAMDMYDYRPGKAVWERGSIPARGRGARGQAAGRLRSGKGSRGGGLKIPLREIGRPADVARDLMAHVDRKTLPSDAREGYGRGRGRGAASGRGWQEYNTRGRGPDMRPDSAPDSGASAGWGRKIAGESLVPKNLAAYSSIEELLLIFETAIANRSTSLRELVEPPDAVAALNHFKRLQRQTRGKPELAARFDHVLAELVGVAEVGIPYMSAKNIALALNSLSHRHEFSSLFQAAVQRIQMLCDTGFLFHTQSLAMIVNALVKRRMLDAALVRAISEAAQRIEPDSYSPQSVAVILNAFSKVARHDERSLFVYMSEVAMQLRDQKWDAQACALLLNSFARSGERDLALFQHFEGIILEQDLRSFTAQNVANIVNAYAKCGYNITGVFTHMSAAARAIPHAHCDTQAVANILNGFARMNIWDAELFAHLSEASMMTPHYLFSAQGIANTLNAHARMGNRDLDLFRYLSGVIQQGCAQQGLASVGVRKGAGERFGSEMQGRSGRESREVLRFDPQAVANIVNAFARLEIYDEALFATMEEVILGIASGRWDAQAVALVLNAYAKLQIHPPRLFAFLSDLVMIVPSRSFNAQAVANIGNALAKADMKHERLLDHLAELCLKMGPGDFTGQAVSSILNAFAKLDHRHPLLFRRMGDIIMAMPLATFQPQAIANIVNAYIKTDADKEVPGLFERMSTAAQRNPPWSFSGQAVGVIVNAYVRRGVIDEALFAFISKTIQGLKPHLFDAQNIALVTNAFAKAEIFDESLFNYMARVALNVEVRSADAQNVAVIINAFAKADMLENEPATAALMDKLSSDIPRLSPAHTNAQAIGNIVNGYMRFLHTQETRPPQMILRDRQVLSYMGSLALELQTSDFDVQSLTLLTHAFSRIYADWEATDCVGEGGAIDSEEAIQRESDNRLVRQLFVHLGEICQNMPKETIDGQAVASILNALLKVNVPSDDIIEHLTDSMMYHTRQLAASASSDVARGAGQSGATGRLTVQSLVLTVSALARAERNHPRLLVAIVESLLCSDPAEWTGQSCSNLLNGLARLLELHLAPRSLVLDAFAFVSKVVQATEVHMYEGVYDAQNMAIICNAMARIDFDDQELLLHLSLIIQQMHPDQFDVQAVSNIVNAFVKLEVETEVRQYLLDFMAVVAQCFDADEDFSPQSISNIVNAYAKADMVQEAISLFEHMALATQMVPPAEFNAQAVANILNGFGKVARQLQQLEAQVDVPAVFAHLSAAAIAIDPATLDMQNIANIINALAKTYTYDVALLKHLALALRANAAPEDDGSGASLVQPDLSHDTQAMANIMHAIAILNHRDELDAMMPLLIPHIRRLSFDDSRSSAQGIANICWSVAVLQLKDPTLLDWCRRALSSRVTSMNWSCLRQVQQYLLTMELDGLLPADVRISESLTRALSTPTSQLLASSSNSRTCGSEDTGDGDVMQDLSWKELVDVAADSLVRSAWTFSGLLGRQSSGRGTDKDVMAALQFAESPDMTGVRVPPSTVASGHNRGGALDSTGHSTAVEAYRHVLGAEASTSRLQTEVMQRVVELGLAVEEEFVDDQTGYSLDIYLPQYRCGVEVDGPFHYIANGKSQLGSTVMKHRHLRQCGFALIVIPFFEWNVLNGRGESDRDRKLAYLRAKFDQALPSTFKWQPHVPQAMNLAELSLFGSPPARPDDAANLPKSWREGKAKAAQLREAAKERLRARREQKKSPTDGTATQAAGPGMPGQVPPVPGQDHDRLGSASLEAGASKDLARKSEQMLAPPKRSNRDAHDDELSFSDSVSLSVDYDITASSSPSSPSSKQWRRDWGAGSAELQGKSNRQVRRREPRDWELSDDYRSPGLGKT